MSHNVIRRWLRRHHIFTGRVDRVIYYPERHDLPEIPRANELAVAGSPDFPKWLLIDCPCGKGHTVLVPLSKRANPAWRISIDDRHGPSVFPSIDRNRHEGERCHYWIKNGQIHWA
ncbi:DUF6527 family protein [Arthrobacter sp. RCC_34]|uniref:DUF6527 family protein n=1 Tax=Arthrobacter sp. RCC_34 TaxID=3239230 RepID=UPI0035252B26